MPEVVLDALRRFEVEARANVTRGYTRGRARPLKRTIGRARGSHASSTPAGAGGGLTYGTTSSINLLAHSFGRLLQPGDEIGFRFSSTTAIWCPGSGRRSDAASFCGSCP